MSQEPKPKPKTADEVLADAQAESASEKIEPKVEPKPEPKPEDKAASGSEPSQPASGDASPAGEKGLMDQLLLLKAEFENYRKRTDREKPEFIRLGKAQLILKFLPVYDLLQRAHQEILKTHTDTPVAKGMEGIFKEFEKIFKEEGVTVMEAQGKPFDAMRHEIMGTVEKEGVEDGSVAEVLEHGFMMQDRVLRTAKVRVAKTKQE